MYKFLRILSFPIDYFFIGLVWLYKIFISPLKPKTCRFIPSCSIYMILCIKSYGSIKGILLGTKRLLKCNPKSDYGFDPIPINIKGDFKWLL